MCKRYFSILAQWPRFLISYTCSHCSDTMNRCLPIFQPTDLVMDVPAMRAPSIQRRGSGDSMEDLIRWTPEESDDDDDDDDDGNAGTVEKVSERIASGRKVAGKPMPSKRHETT